MPQAMLRLLANPKTTATLPLRSIMVLGGSPVNFPLLRIAAAGNGRVFSVRVARSKAVQCSVDCGEREMEMEDLVGGVPAYAKDLKLNYSSLVKQNTELTAQQLWGT